MQTKRILIIDDDKTARAVHRMLLSAAGHFIEEAENGVTAIDQFKANEGQFDLVLVDYNMPDMNGASVTQALREIEADLQKYTLIIGITAHIDPNIKSICLAAGMSDVISKPISVSYLRDLCAGVKDPQYCV
jgi:CheY-like chemotaxis protein